MELRKKILSIPLVFFILVAVIWVLYYTIGFLSFNKQNAVAIFGSVIQGMSALLSVAIAVIIFRIQSLENRNQSLEQSTLNYIHHTTGWSYPTWTSSTEGDIRNKSITNRYYSLMRARRIQVSSRKISQEEQKFQLEERDRQQKRLEETLDRHSNIAKTIQRIRSGFITSAIFLIAPILSSLLMLMVSDAFDSFWNFVCVSNVISISALGIVLLIRIVLESTVE